MNKVVLFITAGSAGWQQQCMHWAKSGYAFRINGLAPQHKQFLGELCHAYKLDCEFSKEETVVKCCPKLGG